MPIPLFYIIAGIKFTFKYYGYFLAKNIINTQCH